MAEVVYSARALADLERAFDFLAREEARLAAAAVEAIADAVGILERHPFVGRPVLGELRELVISHGRTGYVALYRVRGASGRVEILAIRHQREAGFY
ncbi:MAG: type II toxin-antitoxin system RelE/ParE family toxin [Myxococcales bacterium]|nr:type II toxin-antitoxin system RelE/ParE family toxin [Myxococcales bacterium]